MTCSTAEDLAQERLQEFEDLRANGLIPHRGSFFPSVHYPPITMYPAITPSDLLAGYRVPDDMLFDLYYHIPFCKQYCSFCHYPNQVGIPPAEKDRYLQAIAREQDILLQLLDLPKFSARSILVGGGTPTCLSPAQLERFLHDLTARVDTGRCTQFNYDVDPLTFLGQEGMERRRILRAYGVGRLTIGIQSLDPKVLLAMNRHHGVEEALSAVEQSLQDGFQINIEFIYGYPGQTLESWIATMEQAVGLGVHEIQIYQLKFAPYGDHSGRIASVRSRKSDDLPWARRTTEMKAHAHCILAQHNYRENLTRVFSTHPKYYSHYAHNQCCDLRDQLGFGLTGFSSLRDRFGLNTQHIKQYYAAIEQGRLPLNRGLVRNPEDQIRWSIILPLKNRKVLRSVFQQRTGTSLAEVFRPKIETLKKADLIHEDRGGMALTERGRFFADQVCQQFHHPRYMPFPPETYRPGKLHPALDNTP